MYTPHDFLTSLFPTDESLPGFIEVRLVSDLLEDRCYGQHWYQSPNDLISEFDKLLALSNLNNACAAFSPAIRSQKRGNKDSAKGGWCLWTDLDSKSCPQRDCISRLVGGDLDLTVVNSGRGAHGYVLLDSFCSDIGTLETANRLLRNAYGGDKVQDASRVMRLPGTMNHKDAANPLPSEILQSARMRYSIDDIIQQLTISRDPMETLPELDDHLLLAPAVQLAVNHDEVLQRLSPATASLVFDAKRTGERSEADMALVNRLVAEGLTDPQVKAIFSRYPCGEKAVEGTGKHFEQYMDRTIKKARNNGHLFNRGEVVVPESSAELQAAIGVMRGDQKGVALREALARAVVTYFCHHGRLFTDGEYESHLHYEGRTYRIADTSQFRALLQEVADLSLVNLDGKLTLDRLANHAVVHGQRTTTRGPVHSDRKSNRIYISCGEDHGHIVVASPGQVDEVVNGCNPDNICLVAPPEFAPLEYVEDVSTAEALGAYQSLLVDRLACDEVDRLTIKLWLPNVLLLGYSWVKILMKFSGNKASGKTVASRLIGCLVAGSDILEVRPSAAALYASRMPLQILDNVENKDLRRSMEDIVIFAATGGVRSKMRLNSDDQRIRQEVNRLLIINGIESLSRAEVLDRVYELVFSRSFRQSHFLETSAIEDLLDARNLILSGWLRIFANHVLPRIEEGGIVEWKDWLDSTHGNHPKARSFEFLARMGLIAEAMLQVEQPSLSRSDKNEEARRLVAGIVQRQGTIASEAQSSTSSLVQLIGALAHEVLHSAGRESFESEYHVDAITDRKANGVRIRGTAADLLWAFGILTRKTGILNLTVNSPRSLAARLRDEATTLEASGIMIEDVGRRNNSKMYELWIGCESEA